MANYCTNCGTKLRSDDNFCYNCGTRVDNSSVKQNNSYSASIDKKDAKKELKKLIERENIDIIHGHYLLPAGWASVKAGKSTNTKTYVTSHGSDMFEMYNTMFSSEEGGNTNA